MAQTFVQELHSEEARRAVAEVVLAIFARWGLHEAKQAQLLDLPDIAPLCAGGPLPDVAPTLERAGHLLAIDRALQRLFPDDRVLRDGWAVFPSSQFDGHTPLSVMLTGIAGMMRVRSALESAKW